MIKREERSGSSTGIKRKYQFKASEGSRTRNYAPFNQSQLKPLSRKENKAATIAKTGLALTPQASLLLTIRRRPMRLHSRINTCEPVSATARDRTILSSLVFRSTVRWNIEKIDLLEVVAQRQLSEGVKSLIDSLSRNLRSIAKEDIFWIYIKAVSRGVGMKSKEKPSPKD